MSDTVDTIRSAIWAEEQESDNPFAARVCRCHGYDVFGDLLGKVSWPEYWLLLFKGEPPREEQVALLDGLAVALANAGPRDYAVRAAMNGAVGGAHGAGVLMAALGVGAGQLGGARDLFLNMGHWQAFGEDVEAWCEALATPGEDEIVDAWTTPEHPPGFDPHGRSCATPVKQLLSHLAMIMDGSGCLGWLDRNRERLEAAAGAPLALSGVAAAAMNDLGLNPQQGELLFLMLRLPGAAVHAMEQARFGRKDYPFWANGLEIVDDPGPYDGEPGAQLEALYR